MAQPAAVNGRNQISRNDIRWGNASAAMFTKYPATRLRITTTSSCTLSASQLSVTGLEIDNLQVLQRIAVQFTNYAAS